MVNLESFFRPQTCSNSNRFGVRLKFKAGMSHDASNLIWRPMKPMWTCYNMVPDVEYESLMEFWDLYDEAVHRFMRVMREHVYHHIMDWMRNGGVSLPGGHMCELLYMVSKRQGRQWCARVSTHAIMVVCNAMRIQLGVTKDLLAMVPHSITDLNYAVQARWLNNTVFSTIGSMREFLVRDLMDHNFVMSGGTRDFRYLSWPEVRERRLAWLLLTNARLSGGSLWSGLDLDIIEMIGRLQLY